MLTHSIEKEEYTKFEYLYDTYAPKLYGFIKTYTRTKEEADQYMEKVFLQVCRDLNYFDSNAEKKLLNIVLLICRPLLKKSNTYSTL